MEETPQFETVAEVLETKKVRKQRSKKADLNTRIGKYYINRQKGMNKKESQLAAGFADPMHPTRIEATKTYKAIEQRYYKDELLKQISLTDIATEQIKNIMQDNDRGAKNKAIEMALDRIEPESGGAEIEEKVVILLKGNKPLELQ